MLSRDLEVLKEHLKYCYETKQDVFHESLIAINAILTVAIHDARALESHTIPRAEAHQLGVRR